MMQSLVTPSNQEAAFFDDLAGVFFGPHVIQIPNLRPILEDPEQRAGSRLEQSLLAKRGANRPRKRNVQLRAAPGNRQVEFRELAECVREVVQGIGQRAGKAKDGLVTISNRNDATAGLGDELFDQSDSEPR